MLFNFFIIATIISFAQGATNADFAQLKIKIQAYINKNPDRHIPLIVRTNFHDLQLQSPQNQGIHGCLAGQPFLNFFGNEGLSSTIADLQAIVKADFPRSNLTFGDVIAFAGKIAVESAYPCINIPFRFNRNACAQKTPDERQAPPDGFIDRMSQLSQTTSQLGMTPNEFAVLLAGAHGIKGAAARPSGWVGTFAHVSSGKDYIAQSLNQKWVATTRGTLFQFVTNPADLFGGLIRLPIDFLFFPSRIPAGSFKDTTAAPVEAFLTGFTTRPRLDFDQEFGRVFAKMLEVGVSKDPLIPFTESVVKGICPEPASPTTTATTTTTTTTSAPVTTVTTKSSFVPTTKIWSSSLSATTATVTKTWSSSATVTTTWSSSSSASTVITTSSLAIATTTWSSSSSSAIATTTWSSSSTSSSATVTTSWSSSSSAATVNTITSTPSSAVAGTTIAPVSTSTAAGTKIAPTSSPAATGTTIAPISSSAAAGTTVAPISTSTASDVSISTSTVTVLGKTTTASPTPTPDKPVNSHAHAMTLSSTLLLICTVMLI